MLGHHACLCLVGAGRPTQATQRALVKGPVCVLSTQGPPKGHVPQSKDAGLELQAFGGWGSDLPHCLMAGPMCAERGPRKLSLWASRPRAQPVHGRRERDHLEAQLLGFLSARWQEGLCSSTAGDMQM